MLKIFKLILLISFFFFLSSTVYAKEYVNIYFFYGNGCPHCEKEMIFLEKLKNELDYIKIYEFEVWNDRKNAKFLAGLAHDLKLVNTNVPIVIIGDSAIPGFLSEETTGETIRSVLDYYTMNTCFDIVAPILGIESLEYECSHDCHEDDIECFHDCGCSADKEKNIPIKINKIQDKINIPFFGSVETKNISLPVLTVLIGVLDGFNPCAMWALLFLISLLINMQNKRKMWVLGSVFIITSGFVYFLFLTAWLNLFLFLGFIFWIRIAIASVAIASGIYHLREYFKNKDGQCKVTGSEKRKNYFNRLKNIVNNEKFIISLIGIIALAASVNLVELLCSAGLPAVYTQILTLSNLPLWQYYSYLILYILIFILDDLIIFFLAMSALQMKVISSKYSRWSNLIGGILMLIIGLLLVLKPGWLMFG